MDIKDKFSNLKGKAQEWKEKRRTARQSKINQKVEETLPDKAGPNYSLIKQIDKSPYASKAASKADAMARQFLDDHIKGGNANRIVPGQLILFDYFEPKTKEDLEYYDAGPLTIFFNVIKTKEGKRVLGFNLHYFPPRMRKQIMNTIFNIYKPVYTEHFEDGTKSSMSGFNYKYIMESLQKAGLDFGVRMYIPELINNVRAVPPQLWHVAVYTEGWFKKRTWEAVMRYWKQWTRKNVKKTKAAKPTGDRKKK